MAKRIGNRKEFIEYCLRALGAPVLLINVDNDQVEDRVDDALQMYWSYHADGSKRTFVKHQLTEEDIKNERIELPENVISVLRVLPIDGTKATINLQYQMFITEIMNIRRLVTGGVHSYAITSSYLDTINNVFNSEKAVTFNHYQNYLTMDTDWSNLRPGDYIVIECYVVVDPEEYNEAWNDIWLKQYATALIKRQWGQNLSKFSGAQLPGGITVNGLEILSEAKAEIEALEERLRNEFQYPIDFMMG